MKCKLNSYHSRLQMEPQHLGLEGYRGLQKPRGLIFVLGRAPDRGNTLERRSDSFTAVCPVLSHD